MLMVKDNKCSNDKAYLHKFGDNEFVLSSKIIK